MSDRLNTEALDTQRAWTVGGALVLLAVVVDAGAGGFLPDGGLVRALLLAAALAVFAVGVRGSGSVTALRPTGTIALCALAATLVVSWVVNATLLPMGGRLDVFVVVGQVILVLQFALALIAVERIGRLAVVPRPWNWAPAIVFGVIALLFAATAIASVMSRQMLEVFGYVAVTVNGIASVAALVVLGVLAIVLGDRAGRAPSPEVVSQQD
ncbi:MAG: hypothetical protein KJ659_01900 [Actinobacteria bacterium]|nr:hypothetical protein [Actinomycetota bacterium]MBU1608845.1 hypothetical protein [Actinomycetota bacterium]MBU2314564.1 hypothetical protein [Actinomycetota bacterium]MBU2384241.1 hypothetical protein [Actinomycetota bacterium]